MTAREPSVLFYVLQAERLLYPLAKTLALGGIKVTVLFQKGEQRQLEKRLAGGSADAQYGSWLIDDPDIQFVSENEVNNVDAIVYNFTHESPQDSDFIGGLLKSASVVIGFDGSSGRPAGIHNVKPDLGTIWKFKQFLPATRSILTRRADNRGRLLKMAAPLEPLGFFPHPIFFKSESLRNAIFANDWEPEQPRTLKIMFSGGTQPEIERGRPISNVREHLRAMKDIRMFASFQEYQSKQEAVKAPHKCILWLPVDGMGPIGEVFEENGVPLEKWTSTLSASDFTFCPPGHAPKTHRVIESLLRGSIPILDCPEEYAIGLKDGETCIAVNNNNWVEAVERALALTEIDLIAIRHNIFECRRKFLTLDASCKRLTHNLGLSFNEGDLD